jgi:hypothetical protein
MKERQHNVQKKPEKKCASALDNYVHSCFVRSDFLKMKCVCKTQMIPPRDQIIVFVRPDIDACFVWISPPIVLELQL